MSLGASCLGVEAICATTYDSTDSPPDLYSGDSWKAGRCSIAIHSVTF